MKKKYKLLFKYDIDKYQSGTTHELELTIAELNRLTRRGCIFAKEDAELTKVQEVKKQETKEIKVKAKKQSEKELDNVDNKKSKQKTKVQADSTDKE